MLHKELLGGHKKNFNSSNAAERCVGFGYFTVY